MCVCVYIYICVCVYIYIYIYIYMCVYIWIIAMFTITTTSLWSQWQSSKYDLTLTCQTEAQFWQNLYMTKKESLPDRQKFCQSGSAVRHLFWRLQWVEVSVALIFFLHWMSPWPWENWMKLKRSNSQSYFSESWLRNLFWNHFLMNGTGHYWR